MSHPLLPHYLILLAARFTELNTFQQSWNDGNKTDRVSGGVFLGPVIICNMSSEKSSLMHISVKRF